MAISIAGLGTISDTQWNMLQPDAPAHLLVEWSSGAELWIGETPRNEDFWHERSVLKWDNDDIPASTFYTSRDFDTRIDLYGYGAPATSIDHKVFPLGDDDILRWTDAEVELLKLAVRTALDAIDAGKRVAVNCQAGLNRSGLVSALVMIADGFTADEAIYRIHVERSELCLCNESFVWFLQKHGKSFVESL